MKNLSENRQNYSADIPCPIDECRLAELKLAIVRGCLDDALVNIPVSAKDSPLFGLMLALAQIIK